MTSEIKVSSRKATYGMLFAAAVAIAMLFLNTGKAYAGETTQGTTTSGSGAAALGTGDASGSGNTSGTTADQGGSGSQGIKITNSGSGSANTGGNTVAGNKVDNDLEADQENSGSADNAQAVDNELTGTASVTTGNAKASGNNASTSVTQKAEGNGSVNQTATVENIGTADANTGDNEAFGNLVDNDLDVDQSADEDGFVGGAQVNAQAVDNELTGAASITTGDADASGNYSSTGIAQWASTSNGASGGVASASQAASVTNHGEANANTGENFAAGNDVVNDLEADQGIEIRGPPIGGVFVIAVIDPLNEQAVDNDLVGTASVATGDASASGNAASTSISQEACASCEDGYASITQTAEVNNVGIANANTGRNHVVGNDIDNDLDVDQSLDFDLLIGDAFVDLTYAPVNAQAVDNDATGSASLVTGDASASGNRASNSIRQKASAAGNVDIVQSATVNNHGEANANTGENYVAGNAVDNDLDVDQALDFELTLGDLVADLTYTPFNAQAVDNDLSGTAALATGDASASGNVASTGISQEVCATGTGSIGQHAKVTNSGVANANTGRNDVIGNDLVNDLFADQSLELDILIGDAFVDLSYAPFNAQAVDNDLDGAAALTTGNANALGSWSSTGVAQSANVEGTFNHDSSIEISNAGDADANSGDNFVAGNDIVNDLFVDQSLEFDVTLGDLFVDLTGFAFNAQAVDNDAEGTSALATGDADATGNVASVSASSQIGPDIDWDECDCLKGKKAHKAEKKHEEVAHKARAARAAGGGELAFTGAPLAALALLGLVLVALGGIARRKGQATA